MMMYNVLKNIKLFFEKWKRNYSVSLMLLYCCGEGKFYFSAPPSCWGWVCLFTGLIFSSRAYLFFSNGMTTLAFRSVNTEGLNWPADLENFGSCHPACAETHLRPESWYRLVCLSPCVHLYFCKFTWAVKGLPPLDSSSEAFFSGR